MVNPLTTHKALFSLANCPQKHQMPQHAKHQCHNTIINNYTKKKQQRCPLYCFVVCYLFLNGLRRKRKHVIFAHFQSQTTFTSITHIYLFPSRMLLPLFNFGSSPLGTWWRCLHHLPLRRGGGTSTTSGDDSTTTNSSSLQKQETIS